LLTPTLIPGITRITSEKGGIFGHFLGKTLSCFESNPGTKMKKS